MALYQNTIRDELEQNARNMVEIEISVLASQCLDRRIDSYTRLVAEIAACEQQILIFHPYAN